jgi:hypothetical protein
MTTTYTHSSDLAKEVVPSAVDSTCAPLPEPREKRQRPRLGWTTKATAGKTSGARTGEVGPSFNAAMSSTARASAARTGTARTPATETSRAGQARTKTSRAKSGTPGQAEPGPEPGEATKSGPEPVEPGKSGVEPGKPGATSPEPGPSGSTPAKTGWAEPDQAGKQTPVCGRVPSPSWPGLLAYASGLPSGHSWVIEGPLNPLRRPITQPLLP